VKNHIGPLLDATPIKKAQVHVFEKFYAELLRCRKHCDNLPSIDHRTHRDHACGGQAEPATAQCRLRSAGWLLRSRFRMIL
jgi:hypothetical protein